MHNEYEIFKYAQIINTIISSTNMSKYLLTILFLQETNYFSPCFMIE